MYGLIETLDAWMGSLQDVDAESNKSVDASVDYAYAERTMSMLNRSVRRLSRTLQRPSEVICAAPLVMASSSGDVIISRSVERK
jgi:hypothetical protein